MTIFRRGPNLLSVKVIQSVLSLLKKELTTDYDFPTEILGQGGACQLQRHVISTRESPEIALAQPVRDH